MIGEGPGGFPSRVEVFVLCKRSISCMNFEEWVYVGLVKERIFQKIEEEFCQVEKVKNNKKYRILRRIPI